MAQRRHRKAKPRGPSRGPRATATATSIHVEGGARCPPIPPEQNYDGTPDPELARLIAEGQVRYHLHTLRELEAEASQEIPRPAPSPIVAVYQYTDRGWR